MTNFTRVIQSEIRLVNDQFNDYIGRINIKNLRMSFSIEKSLSYSTNTCNFQIYNLSAEKRAKLKDYGDEINIFAGYELSTGPQLLFIGDSTRTTHLFDQPDIITSIQCGDGESSINQRLIKLSYSENISARKIIVDIANKLGLTISFFAPSEDLKYYNGYQFSGMAKDALTEVCLYLDLDWSVQNKQIQILTFQTGTTTRLPTIISQSTGMIGVPQRYTYKRRDLYRAGPKQGYRVKTTLRPEILPGNKVRLISTQLPVDGMFFVDSVRHVGDTYGNDFYSDWELIRL